MTRRFAIFAAVALLAGAAVAVQHDTFLRRWLLPKRELPPTLARRIGDFRVERVAFPEAVIAVGQAAGKRVNFSESKSGAESCAAAVRARTSRIIAASVARRRAAAS